MNNNTVILGCSSLKEYVEEAQRKAGTDYPAIYVSRIYHRDPDEMKEHLRDALRKLPEDVCTVLIAMGYCGGSWEGLTFRGTLVIPRIDDCVSLLLQDSDEPRSDLKEKGHLYVRHKDPAKESFKGIFDRMAEGLDEETRKRYHHDWQEMYSSIDIMDTGINGSREPEYVREVSKDAKWLDAELRFVKAGTYVLEKLLKGEWDDQFLVLGPEETVTKEDVLI